MAQNGMGLSIVLLLSVATHAIGIDQDVTRAVKQAIQRTYQLRDARIEVQSNGGAVTLRGTSSSLIDKIEAELIARRTVGVKSISNQIKVENLSPQNGLVRSELERRIQLSPFASSAEIRIEVVDGKAILQGKVTTWADRQAIEQIAKQTVGVRDVSNELRINPVNTASREEEQLVEIVRSEFDRDRYLAELPITVTVEGGLIKLTGEVPHLFHKEYATEEAKRAGNVRVVSNSLVVESQLRIKSLPSPPTDEELELFVSEELVEDPRVTINDLRVLAKNGKVEIHGNAFSLAEKQSIDRIARQVVGVQGVANRIQVEPSNRTDDEIAESVRFALTSDTTTSSSAINVEVKSGTAVLTGEVPSHQIRFEANRVVGRIRGVRCIKNDLSVKPSEKLDPAIARYAIQQRLETNIFTSPAAAQIHVSVDQEGVATLEGAVARVDQKIEARRIAGATRGIRSVDNQLKVETRNAN